MDSPVPPWWALLLCCAVLLALLVGATRLIHATVPAPCAAYFAGQCLPPAPTARTP